MSGASLLTFNRKSKIKSFGPHSTDASHFGEVVPNTHGIAPVFFEAPLHLQSSGLEGFVWQPPPQRTTSTIEACREDASITSDQGMSMHDDRADVVASEGLWGGTFVEIVPGGSCEMFVDGGLIQDTQGAVSLIQLLMKFVGGVEA